MKRNTIIMTVAILAIVFLTAGCLPVHHAEDAAYNEPAGFLLGIWHGWIAPISLVASLFSESYTIFAPRNSGFWYEFGFYIAILGGFGSFSLVRKNRSKDRD